jgi:hypothetical protein
VKDIAEIDTLRRELESKKYNISEQRKLLEQARMNLCLYKNQLMRAKEEAI